MQASTSVLQVIMPNSFSNCFGDGWLWLVVCQQQPRLCLKDVGNVRFLEPVTQIQSGLDVRWEIDMYNVYVTIFIWQYWELIMIINDLSIIRVKILKFLSLISDVVVESGPGLLCWQTARKEDWDQQREGNVFKSGGEHISKICLLEYFTQKICIYLIHKRSFSINHNM